MTARPALSGLHPDQQDRVALLILSPYLISAEALKALLDMHKLFDVQGSFSKVGDCLKALAGPGQNQVLVLLELESAEAVNDIGELMLASASRRILVLTGSNDTSLHDAAVTAGASGLVRKQESAATLMKAIARVASGELWLDRAATGRIFQALARKKLQPDHNPEQEKIETLTRKERLIVSEVAAMPSASGAELANRLHISEHTLRNHLSAIYAKLELANRTDLYAYARQHNISAPPPRHKRGPRLAS